MEKPPTFRSPTALVVWVVWLLFAVGNWVDLAVQGRDHASVVAAAILLLATGVAYVTAQRPRVIVDDTGLTIKNPVRDHRISWAAVTNVDLMDLLRVHCTLPPRPGQPDQNQGQRDQGRGQGERRKVISAWAVHYSRRRQLNADVRARRAAARTTGGARPSMFGGFPAVSRGMSYGTPPVSAGSVSAGSVSAGATSARDTSTEADAKMIVRLISERATAARAEAPASADATTPAPTATSATATTEAPADTAKLLTSTWSNTAIAALVIPALILLLVILL